MGVNNNQVFRARTPPEAIDLVSRLLEYTPSSRISPLQACAHTFFDELRETNTRLPNELSIQPTLNSVLLPRHAQESSAGGGGGGANSGTDGNGGASSNPGVSAPSSDTNSMATADPNVPSPSGAAAAASGMA
ncbi:hypothetical protein C0J52_15051 [Blattella germanica]|nr:hypothetical protein C0J52_15051 [Blattella germanica]